jgi:hypothetical protein
MILGATFLGSASAAKRAGAAESRPFEAASKLREAIGRLPRKGGASLRIPAGLYRFQDIGQVALGFEDIEDLSIDATGAVFLFNEQIAPISAVNCRNFRLRGGTIDWDRPPFSQGDVLSVAADKRTLDIRVDAGFPVTGGERIETLATYDRASGLMSLGGIDSYNAVEHVQLTGPQRLRLALSQPLGFKTGDTVVMRHQTYGVNAISLEGCDNAVLRDVTIHAAPGMAVVGSGCNGVTIARLRIEPTPGSGRLMSTCADGIHLLGCRGKILIEDCDMRGMGDDCVNVLTPYLRVDQVINSRTLAVSTRNHWWISKTDVIPPVHDLVFLSGRNFRSLGTGRVHASEPGRVEVIHLEGACPSGLEPGDLVMDATANQHKLEVRGCRFPGNRARGVLAHDNATIEDCFFANQFESAILLSQSSWWLEGGPINAVAIDRCTFSGTSRRGRQAAAIQIESYVDRDGAEAEVMDPAPSGTVSISRCTFDQCHGPALSAHAIEELRVNQNVFRDMPPTVILLKNVERPVINENKCSPPGSIIDQDHKTENTLEKNNVGLKVK